MNEAWTQSRVGSTTSGALIGLMAYSAMGLGAQLARTPVVEIAATPKWTANWNAPTSATATISAEAGEPVHATLLRAFNRAADAQKALDPEFARILSDNLWDLYQS